MIKVQLASISCVYSEHHIQFCIWHSSTVAQTLCICLFLLSLKTLCDLTPKPTSFQSQSFVFFCLRLGFSPSFHSILLTNSVRIIFLQTESNPTSAASNFHKEATTGCKIEEKYCWSFQNCARIMQGLVNIISWQIKQRYVIYFVCIPCWMRTSILCIGGQEYYLSFLSQTFEFPVAFPSLLSSLPSS